MELLILGAIIVLDVVVLELGLDGQRAHTLWHHDQALDAIKHGDIETYKVEIERMERDIARGAWRTF